MSGSARHKPFKHRMLKKLMSLSAMVGVGLMMVATTVPANAFYSGADELATAVAPTEVESQLISVAQGADLALTRDGYTVTSLREQIFLKYGNRSFLYTNNPNGTIQWPFPIAVPISDGYGWRLDPCSICVPFHKGVDFTPGVGTVIQAIADGVVTQVGEAHWGLGNHVIIDHVINGKHIQSLYAHMQDGTIRVAVGQTVKVGDAVGQVGSTGESTGPHLHFEIHVNGEPIDPFEWLKANAN
ncbi:MAG: M23 family metallopeptidase [Terrimesophilobacter sp.]